MNVDLALPNPMKRRALIGCTVLLAFLALGAPAWAARVRVCHVKPDSPSNFQTITVTDTALQSHLAHGDLPGECFEHCEQLCDDGNACTVDACDTSGRCLIEHPAVNCDDGNLCTTDSCNPAAGCSSAPRVCSDASLCTVDSCDPLTGDCIFPEVACNPGQTCNLANGNCETPVTCPCTSIAQFNFILQNLNFCVDLGGAVIVSIDPPVTTVLFREAAGSNTSAGQCGYLQFGVPGIVLPVTDEEAAVCIQLIRAAVASRGVTCS